MAGKKRYINFGHVGVPKDKPENRYARINKGHTLIIRTPKGDEITLPENAYISMFKPRKADSQTDEQFEQLSKWKRFDLTIVIEE